MTEIHRGHVLNDRVWHERRLVELGEDRVDIEQAVVAEAQPEPRCDVVEIRPRVEDVRMLADEQQPAAPLDEALDLVDFGGLVSSGRDFDHKHVAIGQRVGVDGFVQPVHLVPDSWPYQSVS